VAASDLDKLGSGIDRLNLKPALHKTDCQLAGAAPDLDNARVRP